MINYLHTYHFTMAPCALYELQWKYWPAVNMYTVETIGESQFQTYCTRHDVKIFNIANVRDQLCVTSWFVYYLHV